MVKISIVVPVYNVEKYLKKFFLTIQNQTLTDFEVWLVDDGSKDNSLAICNKIKSKDKRFHVIHQSNQGSGVARNVGLKVVLVNTFISVIQMIVLIKIFYMIIII